MTHRTLVCVEYTEPSVRHIPWALPVGGAPALQLLLRRLAAGFPGTGRCGVLCMDRHRLRAISAIAEPLGWPVLVSLEPALPMGLAKIFESELDECDVLLFSSNDIVPDDEGCRRLVAHHRHAGVQATVAADILLDGLVPVVVQSRMVGTLAQLCPGVRDVRWLAEHLRHGAGGADVARLATEMVMGEADSDTLPASPVVHDRWTQRAADAGAAITNCREAGRVFRADDLASRDEIPSIERQSHPERGARTVLVSSMRTPFTGAEGSLLATVSHLDRQRYWPVVLLPFESKLAEHLRAVGVETIVAGWDYSILSPRNLRYCRKVLDACTPDLVHIDLLPSPTLMVAAEARGIPIVGHIRTPPEGRLAPCVLMADRLVAVSEMVARRLRRYNLPGDRVHAIHNGVIQQIPEERIADSGSPRLQLGIPSDACVVTLISRLTPQKKIDLLIAAMSDVLARVPHAWLLIVGEPDPACMAYARDLRAQAAMNGVARRTTWVAFEEDIRRVFAASDVLVLCSTNDAFPRSILEGLAAGVPAIVPAAGGVAELIEDERSGLVFAPDVPGSLAFAILRALTDDDLRASLRQHARARAAHFGVRDHVERLQAVYDELCASARRSKLRRGSRKRFQLDKREGASIGSRNRPSAVRS